MKRRDFLKRVAPMSLLPFAIHGQPIRAYGHVLGAEAEEFVDTDNVLVLVQLNGGNDGLNTVLPLSEYSNLSAARADVLIPENKALVIDDTNGTGFHPAMSAMKNMYDDGKLHVVQSVGYPNQNYSHFRSTDIWMSGSDSDEVVSSGWVGRYLQEEWPNYPNGFPNNDMEDPLAIQIGSIVSPVCQGTAVNMGFAVNNPEAYYQLLTGNYPAAPNTWAGKELEYVRTVARQSNDYSARVKDAAESATNLSTKYPDGNRLADQLKIVAQLIKGGLKTRVYIVSLGGFDTHAVQVDPTAGNETGAHAILLQTVSDAIDAFQDDLELMGIDERVLGMTFSEFGRRIVSNASQGTDHGAAAPLFLFGTNVKGGQISGTNPTIPANATVQSQVDMQFDFRNIYSTILQQWFCLSDAVSDSVMLQDFGSMDLLKDSCSTTSSVRERKQRSGDMYITNYPNPFGSHTTIKYFSDGSYVNLDVIDIQGKIVSKLVNSEMPRGEHEISFDASQLPSGTYYCRYQNGMISHSRSMLKVR